VVYEEQSGSITIRSRLRDSRSAQQDGQLSWFSTSLATGQGKLPHERDPRKSDLPCEPAISPKAS
jgi:hypothetical protein